MEPGKTIVSLLILLTFAGPSSAGELMAVVKDAFGKPVKDAVIYAVPASGKTPAVPSPKAKVVDQVDRTFIDHVTPLLVNTPVKFPNSDNIRHHVYSLSKPKTFELPLYIGSPSEPVVFDKPGVVALGCNIHDWMIAYVLVVETPYFGKTGEDGQASVKGMPEDEYNIYVWHPRMKAAVEGELIKKVKIGAAAMQVEAQLKLTPEFRPRRAPVIGAKRY
ncbi:MAG: methylamine utilization protein [Nitrospinae bacterium]|nr:methylamine utilization protein [Nitrospinota bacterium]